MYFDGDFKIEGQSPVSIEEIHAMIDHLTIYLKNKHNYNEPVQYSIQLSIDNASDLQNQK